MNSLLLALKFRDGCNYRNDGEETAEASLDAVFWEFGNLHWEIKASLSIFRSSKPSGAVD